MITVKKLKLVKRADRYPSITLQILGAMLLLTSGQAYAYPSGPPPLLYSRSDATAWAGPTGIEDRTVDTSFSRDTLAGASSQSVAGATAHAQTVSSPHPFMQVWAGTQTHDAYGAASAYANAQSDYYFFIGAAPGVAAPFAAGTPVTINFRYLMNVSTLVGEGLANSEHARGSAEISVASPLNSVFGTPWYEQPWLLRDDIGADAFDPRQSYSVEHSGNPSLIVPFDTYIPVHLFMHTEGAVNWGETYSPTGAITLIGEADGLIDPTIAIDSLTPHAGELAVYQVTVAAVPVPAALPLFLSVIGLFGWLVRRV